MRSTRPGMFEYEVEADLRAAFRRRGAERVAFETIIGSGPNATVLHYVSNRRRIEPGDLVLLDAGCEVGYYASDITRTWPVSGRFTAPQRALYQVVLDAQLAAIEASKPGATVDGIHHLTIRKLVEGMVAIGLMSGEVDAIIKDESFKRYYMHRTSHWLGLDVHDVGAYYQDGQSRVLEPGMVLTIEPGLYVSERDEQAPAELRGIGVRIEDCLAITPSGHENLTAALPKTVADVEAFCGG
jgi:Xaa-Pro aminopeptidase